MTFRVVSALCATSLVAFMAPAFAQPQKAGPLTLPQALQRAANANPRLTTADRTIAMADGRREQADALPNPTIGLEVDNFAIGQTSSVGGAETTLLLSQLIELGGKRDVRVAGGTGRLRHGPVGARSGAVGAAVGDDHRLRRGAAANGASSFSTARRLRWKGSFP